MSEVCPGGTYSPEPSAFTLFCAPQSSPHRTSGLVGICNCSMIELSGLVYECVGS